MNEQKTSKTFLLHMKQTESFFFDERKKQKVYNRIRFQSQ